jgi:integrase/recombinase XerD
MIIAARDGFGFWRKVHTDTLPTKLAHILPSQVRNTLLQAWRKPARKKDVTGLTACPKKGFRKTDSLPLLHHLSWLPSSLLRSGRRPHSMNDHQSPKPQRSRKATNHTTDARAAAQRAKLDAQTGTPPQESVPLVPVGKQKKKKEPQRMLSDRRTSRTVEQAIGDYILDHEGGNRSKKTIEWHRTALRFLREFLAQERQITLVGEITAPDLTTWFVHLRKSPGAHGKLRSERTVQTYARSARAFFHWLVRQNLIVDNPFDRVVFPKVGKPIIKTITPEEFELLLRACTPPNETGVIATRAAVRNRAILWMLYDSGIRVSELCGLHVGDFDRKQGLLTVKGKGSKERRIALGSNCQRNLFYYLDQYRPDQEELAEWGSPDEDHLFLSETRLPLTKNGMTQLFARLKKRSGITGKRISPHIFRHTFAIRYLILGNDPFSLQELLGHEDMATVKNYMHMNDEVIQEQKRKYSPGDHLPTRMPGPRDTRRQSSTRKAPGRKREE